MEIALDSAIPTYSGGLGVLAGDTLKAAADLGLPMVAVTLVYRLGHFVQHLDAGGVQTSTPDPWSPGQWADPLPERVVVEIEGRPVQVAAWHYSIRGVRGHEVPVLLLDTDVPENEPADRLLTDDLYGGDAAYRLSQEAILGLGGVRMLHALGLAQQVHTYHLNEGHTALAPLALLEIQAAENGVGGASPWDYEVTRNKVVFTTHTPVAAGHDLFAVDLMRRVLGSGYAEVLSRDECASDRLVNMTRVALFFSRYATGVSMRHGQVSRGMFPEHPIDSITNGVHAERWTVPPFQALFDRHTPNWREENFHLREAVNLPLEAVASAHRQAKEDLVHEVARRAGTRLDPDVFTIGFARRATAYKRPALLLSDLDRLSRIATEVGPLQVVYAGKSHPRDDRGQAIIREIFSAAEALRGRVSVVYLEDYDMDLARTLCAGVDVWLNTPEQPLEASGTSGMKAALNGVPSFSVLDGWWIEGHIEGVTGWSIRDESQGSPDDGAETASLYDKLEHRVLPLFYREPAEYARVMRSTIELNGSFFNAQRMVRQYRTSAYLM